MIGNFFGQKKFHPFLPFLVDLLKDKETATFVVLTILNLCVVFAYVDLRPHVDQNFFFSSDDPQFQDDKKISQLFVRRDTQVIISATGAIDSDSYYQKVKQISDALFKIRSIRSIKSLAYGPKNFHEAMASPLWKRLLISQDQKSTNIIVLLDDKTVAGNIPYIERIMKKFSSDDFRLNISGIPYIVELIQRNLLKDLRFFTFLVLFVFTFVIYGIFRHSHILIGTMLACLNACLWTFMIADICKIPIGLMTANLATIICVMTISHIVFLTFNWKNIASKKISEHLADEAVRMTFHPSFWCMCTVLFGFLSLLFVPAKPLRELGISGSIGAISALIAVYTVYPAFLKKTKINPNDLKPQAVTSKPYEFLRKNTGLIFFGIAVLCILSIFGLRLINTDPSMLSFFSKKGELYKGLEYIDRNGGSSPLLIAVSAKNNSLLNSQHAYEQLWKLQQALEQHPDVGSVISLPVVMAQAKEEPLAIFLFWDWLLDILEKPQFDEIAKSFVTSDRKDGLFILRMNELNRHKPRLEVIDELKKISESQGFSPEIIGGVYALQGHLARLVVTSLISGLSWLLFLFTIIAWIVSRSWKITIAMILSIALIPLNILGFIGFGRIPLDVISSPASNVAIAMGIDSMIHIVRAYRRRIQRSSEGDIWEDVREEMWRPVLTYMLILVLGFGIFLFSTFPPTQRFGTTIVYGTILSALVSLFVMPSIVQWELKKLKAIKR